MVIFRDDDDGPYERRQWKLGDPIDDANGGTLDAQNWGRKYRYDDDRGSQHISREEFFIRKGKTASIEGDHLKAIEFFKEAASAGEPIAFAYAADEYETLGNYDAAEDCWDKYCGANVVSTNKFMLRGNFLYRVGRYERAIESYEEIVNEMEAQPLFTIHYLRENKFINNYLNAYARIIDSYCALGRNDLAEHYRKKSKYNIGKMATKAIEVADDEMESGEFMSARRYYRIAVTCDADNAVAKRKYDECSKICDMDYETRSRMEKEAKKNKEIEDERKRREERRKKFEEERTAVEKQLKEFEEQERKRKEECEKNPDCIKMEIENRKTALRYGHLRLHLDYYQKKSDEAFGEILRLEELLEGFGVKRYSARQDIEILRKDISHLKYCIDHFDDKYRENAIKLMIRYHNQLDMLEKKYPEREFFKTLKRKVFTSKNDDIKVFEIEVSAGAKVRKAEKLLAEYNVINTELQEAMDLLDEAKSEISGYLKDKNGTHLMNLKDEITGLEEIACNKFDMMIDINKESLFVVRRDEYFDSQFRGMPGMDLKLLKKDTEDNIAVYYGDKPVGILCENPESDFEKEFCDASQLKSHSEILSAKYFFRYGRFDLIKIDVEENKRKLKVKQRKILRKYLGDGLIAVDCTGQNALEFSEGMKYRLIKESDYESTYNIGVYLDDEKIGSVLNEYMGLNMITKASGLNIANGCCAEYLLTYDDKYPIARIINKLDDDKSKDNGVLADETDILKEETDYVRNSTCRTKALISLEGGEKTPSEIAKDAGILRNSIYNTLKQLKEHELIECLNPEVKRGKVYRLTEKGESVVKNLE